MGLVSSEEFAVKELESDRKKFICMKTAMPPGFVFIFILAFGKVGGTVVLITSANESLPFPDTEANFAPRIPGAGILGLIHLADPSNGCLPLVNGPASSKSPFSSFVVIIRGQCTFESKVRNAQNAGYAAAIIYNNEETQELVTMSGDSAGIHIPAVFISKGAGDVLLEYARDSGSRCYILPAFEYTAWSVMAVSFISLLAVTAVLATFFFVRRHQLRHLGSRLLTRESSGMSAREVKALPSLTFRHPVGSVTSETCAICLEDYEPGQKLRVLPCHHEFHVACVDQWLTTRRPFCPVCKRDAHSKCEVPVVSENTPLLASPGSVPIPTPIVTHTSLGRMSVHSLGSFDAPGSNVGFPAPRPQILRSHSSYSSPLSSPVAASRLNPDCRRVASTPQIPL